MTRQEVEGLLAELSYYLKIYPTLRAHHADMREFDREIAEAVRKLKTRGADTPD